MLRSRVCSGTLLEGNEEHPKTQRTRKRRFLERSVFCVFGCVAFSGALCSPLMQTYRLVTSRHMKWRTVSQRLKESLKMSILSLRSGWPMNNILTPLRAKGTLISEPRFSTPCEMQFFPREKGKTAFSKKNPQQRPFSLSRVGKIASRRG